MRLLFNKNIGDSEAKLDLNSLGKYTIITI